MNSIQIGAIVMMLAITAAATEPNNLPKLRTVDSVNLSRYSGRWYEIARYLNRFQRDCESNTTAEYTILKDGKVQVVNSCRQKEGKMKTARGKAKVVDKTTNAKLKVTFFWPFYGDYWIIGLDPEYRYAIVGEPKRKYLWILSRVPHLDDATYNQILTQIQAAGYDPKMLIRTPQ